MAKVSDPNRKLEEFNHDHDEEEALSLCDLPINEGNQSEIGEIQIEKRTEEDFDFGSWNGSILRESEMCAADDVFFKGQILPLRFSVSSDNGFAGFRSNSRNPSRSVSRSESISGGFTSRSSSSRSNFSSSSSSTNKTYKSEFRNQFHMIPSPKPQIKVLNSSGNSGGRNQKSGIWDFFRLGLVRTPEIELQDLKIRSRILNGEKKKNRGILGDCRCSVEIVDHQLKRTGNGNGNGEREREMKSEKQTGKHAMSRNRTFEWIKDLSHPSLA